MSVEEQITYYIERVRQAGINLVSSADRARLKDRHLTPSLECLDLLSNKGKLLDVGSGGGFPGIPIAIHRPKLSVYLVESNARKAAFLRRVSRETTLKNVEVLHLRVEDLGETHYKQYDIITVRAVAKMDQIIKWTERLLKPGGKWLLWKGSNWRSEADLENLGLDLKEERLLSDGSRLLELERL